MLADKKQNFSMECIKLMMFVANLIFVLLGLLLLSIGLTIKSNYSDFDHFLVDHYYDASKLAIAIGIITFAVALFGCVGAIKQSVFLINIYSLLLLMILIMEVSVSIVAFSMKHNMRRIIRREMTQSMKYYNSYARFAWDASQYNMHCCGVEGPDDWKVYKDDFNLTDVPMFSFALIAPSDAIVERVTHANDIRYTVPTTCCFNEICHDHKSVYTHGCLHKITSIVYECALLLGVGAFCISLIQVLGVIFSNLMAKSIRRLKTQREMEKIERRQHIYEQLANAANLTEKVSPVLYTPSSSEA